MDLSHFRVNYNLGNMDESTVPDDPIVLFSQWLNEVIESGQELEPNGMVLSTCRPNGIPNARVVLLKSIDQDGFVFFTNYESAKGEDIKHNPNVSLTFWWQNLHRQVRIIGKAQKVTAEISDEYFKSRPEGSQKGAIISPQSQVIPSRDFLNQRLKELDDKKLLSLERPSYWGGYLIKPNYFEFWQGKENRIHDRISYSKKSNVWHIDRLAP